MNLIVSREKFLQWIKKPLYHKKWTFVPWWALMLIFKKPLHISLYLLHKITLKPGWHSSVSRTSGCLVLFCEGGMEIPVLSPTNACLQVCRREWLGCQAGYQEVSRCHTRGESQGISITYASPSANKANHSGFETQRRHHKRSPKQGINQKTLNGLFT